MAKIKIVTSRYFRVLVNDTKEERIFDKLSEVENFIYNVRKVFSVWGDTSDMKFTIIEVTEKTQVV